MKNKMKQLLGIILSLVLALGLMPGMSMTVQAATTLTDTFTTNTGATEYTGNYSKVTASVASGNEGLGIAHSNNKPITIETLHGEIIDKVVLSGITNDQNVYIHPSSGNVTNTLKGGDCNYKLNGDGAVEIENINSTTLTISFHSGYLGTCFYANVVVYCHELPVDITGVELNKTSTTLTVGETDTLTATVNPDNSDHTVAWSSNNESVATVSDGVVTAVAEGTATITVTATNGTEDTSDDKKATCVVKVNAASSSGDSSESGSGDSSGGSSDNTNTDTDTSATVPYDDVAISTGAVNDITGTAAATAESNPFETKIENNDSLTTLLALTPEEVAQGVNVWLDIQDMSATVPQADKDLVQNASANYNVGMYLDINLFKKVGGNTATKITETNGTVKASILIPESMWKAGRTFEIIRVHDGVATAIEGTYDENTHVFTFETDKFSTYALAYKDSASSSGSGITSDSGSSDSSNSTQSSTPKTGDPNDIRVWYLLLLVSLGGLGFLGFSKKKEN